MLRVVVVDDHPLFREGLRTVLSAAADLDLVGEAASGEECLDLLADQGCDVVLMDLLMPGMGGLEATRQLVPRCAVVVLTMSEEDEALTAAMRAGATGYLVKGASPEAVVAAVRAAARGESVFGGPVAARVRSQLATGGTTPFPQLSDRERDVLRLLGGGLTNQAIAERLVLAPKSVRNVVSTVLTKLPARDRHDAAEQARRAGLR